eukprot:TRINITY_DN2561_c1_g1_i1.p1 TRINITY_DN2561_c1_g1~~TRINITY_DN2561_c1_g1_i1.p1  ORF type:complete len:455 (+),score=149.17 TRINITY_DN2561_c1_g1_i1:77-1366(+)
MPAESEAGASVKDAEVAQAAAVSRRGSQLSRQGSKRSQQGAAAPAAEPPAALPPAEEDAQPGLSARPSQRSMRSQRSADLAGAAGSPAAEPLASSIAQDPASAHAADAAAAAVDAAAAEERLHATVGSDAVGALAPAAQPPEHPAEEVVEEPAPAPPEAPAQGGQDLEAALQDALAQVRRLEQANESLTRLMQSSSNDARLRVLTEDLKSRSATIKKLEEEVRRQKDRADKAEAAAARAPPAAAQARRPSDSKALQEKDAALKALQQKVQQQDAEIRELRELNADQSALQQAQGLIMQMRQGLAERDTELQLLRQKLDRAQEAIVGSAGCGFETDVKLHRARGALVNILKATEGSSPRRSCSPAGAASSPPSQRGYSSPLPHQSPYGGVGLPVAPARSLYYSSPQLSRSPHRFSPRTGGTVPAPAYAPA